MNSFRITWMALALLAFLTGSTFGQIAKQKIAGNLDKPVDITNAGDGSGRLFIVLQTGKIVIYNGTRILSTPFLTIGSEVSCCGERGLLSLVFHPNYKSNGFFYVHYTKLSGDVVIARYRVSSNPNIADAQSRKILLAIPHRTHSNHNGGKLQFGRDGYLYISIGDGGGAGDQNNNAQNLGSLLGKLLRIDVDHGLPYTIPPTNPYVNVTGALKEIWARGLRNPWRWSFDHLNGDAYIGDVGQDSWEEIDFQKATTTGGQNYGWRRMEGIHCFNPRTNCNNGRLKLPILEYSHSTGGCTVTSGYVYRGSKIPQIYGTYLYSDYCDGIIHGAKRNNDVWTSKVLLNTFTNISTFGEDQAGELYFAHHSATSPGAIYRIVKQ